MAELRDHGLEYKPAIYALTTRGLNHILGAQKILDVRIHFLECCMLRISSSKHLGVFFFLRVVSVLRILMISWSENRVNKMPGHCYQNRVNHDPITQWTVLQARSHHFGVGKH